jgi:hypothetical protein
VRRLAVVGLLAAWPSLRAEAYVRSRTAHGGTPTYWPSSCAYLQPDSGGTPDLSLDTLAMVVQKSLANWQNTIGGCSELTLNYQTPAPAEAHFDGANIIKFRTDRWCHPDDDQSHSQCYDAAAAGITTVFYADHPGQPDDGQILDADIELNDINFTFTVVGALVGTKPRPGTTSADLENTLTHEIGHFMGLDHTCKDAATAANAVDENGNPPPRCDQLGMLDAATQMKITEATMYNVAGANEIKKRSPEADDVAGVCNAYPTGANRKCAMADVSAYHPRGCSVGWDGRPTPAAVGLALFVCAFGLLLRRRRSG